MNDTTAPEETGAPGPEDIPTDAPIRNAWAAAEEPGTEDSPVEGSGTEGSGAANAADDAPEDTVAPESDAASDTEGTAPDADADGTDGTDDDRPAVSPQDRLRALEEEGDIAADYLEELLDIADLDGDIDIDVDGDRASVEIRGAEGLNRLNEPKGELMDALQELARLAVQTRTGNRSRLMLDIGGFRAKNRSELQQLAESAIEQARSEGGPVPLRPMNPFERKVVHDVAKAAGLRSESDGEGKDRHVVIYPAS